MKMMIWFTRKPVQWKLWPFRVLHHIELPSPKMAHIPKICWLLIHQHWLLWCPSSKSSSYFVYVIFYKHISSWICISGLSCFFLDLFAPVVTLVLNLGPGTVLIVACDLSAWQVQCVKPTPTTQFQSLLSSLESGKHNQYGNVPYIFWFHFVDLHLTTSTTFSKNDEYQGDRQLNAWTCLVGATTGWDPKCAALMRCWRRTVHEHHRKRQVDQRYYLWTQLLVIKRQGACWQLLFVDVWLTLRT